MQRSVHVEFFGIPRQRAGVAACDAAPGSLGQVLKELAKRYPQLAEGCLDQGRLRKGFIANLNGDRFVESLDTPLQAGDCLLILSADAGG